MSVVIDSERNKVVVHAKSTAETELGAYSNEYMLLLTMTKDGTQLIRFEEFVDSAMSDKQITPLMKLIAKREKL